MTRRFRRLRQHAPGVVVSRLPALRDPAAAEINVLGVVFAREAVLTGEPREYG